MRWVPGSLFGRLVAVLLAGLVLAQVATLYINASERDQLLLRSGGLHLAQRIADLANLLDSMAPAEREKVAAVFDGPPLAVDLERPALPAPAPAAGDLQLAMFSTMLRHGLGEGMPVVVVRSAEAPARRPPRFAQMHPDGVMRHPMMGAMMGEGPGPAFAPGGDNFLVQVRLRDGAVATFDSYLSPQASAVPTRIALTLLAALLLVLALSLIAMRWLTVPLATLANAAERLGTDLDRPPLPEDGPIEVRRAARAFNTMQQRLARFIADRTRIFTAMSHDMKTPVTRLRLRTELLEDEALRESFVRDLGELEAMVTQTLEYMRDSAAEEPARPIDVGTLLESLRDDYEQTGGEVRLAGEASAPYVGRPHVLRRCLTNLLDNALRYGKRATVVVEDGPAMLTLRVRDEGPGLPPEQLERAFEPFFRGEASRSRHTGGTGLGLGIARNIARAHGGDLVLANRPEGGLEATLTLARDLVPAPAPG